MTPAMDYQTFNSKSNVKNSYKIIAKNNIIIMSSMKMCVTVQNVINSCDGKADFSAVITPVFSVI